MEKISNASIEFSFDPKSRNFSIQSHIFPHACLTKAKFAFDILEKDASVFKYEEDSLHIKEKSETPHGLCTLLTASYLNQKHKLHATIEFALPEELPFLFQRVQLENRGKKTVHPSRFLLAKVEKGKLSLSEHRTEQTAFFSNGWQSWSPTGVWRYGQKQTRSRLTGLATPMLYNDGTPVTKKPSHFSSDMFAALLDHSSKTGLLVGFLSQKEQFGSMETILHPQPELKVWANCDQIDLLPGASLESDWLAWHYFEMTTPQPFEAYLKLVARENQVRPRMKTPVGWCSWYYYFQNITPRVLQNNLESVHSLKETLPLDFFQIDDGYQQDVGSWLKFDPQFPDGVAPLAKEIHQKGFTPGIWLAPFILEHKSKLKKQHPDWLLRKANGKPVNSGFVWNWLGAALDLTHPQVQEYVRAVIRTVVNDWGFPYLKLDFLYAAALPGRHYDPTLTRAQILRRSLELIREEAGQECTLLGCGVPLGPGIGIFDMMRISADVAPTWEPEFGSLKAIFRNEPNMPSARNAIMNILTRANLDPHLWVNDPDCLLVRDDSKLSLAEVQSLATVISMTGGAFLVSDDMTTLKPDRLKMAASLLPVLPPGPEVPDLFEENMPSILHHKLKNALGKWHLIALFNWKDTPCALEFIPSKFGLKKGKYIMREFWTGESAVVSGRHIFKDVPAHGVRLIALRTFSSPAYLGSDLHLSQGVELVKWKENDEGLKLDLDLEGRKAQGNIYVYSRKAILSVNLDGSAVEFANIEPDIYQIPVTVFPTARLEIQLQF